MQKLIRRSLLTALITLLCLPAAQAQQDEAPPRDRRTPQAQPLPEDAPPALRRRFQQRPAQQNTAPPDLSGYDVLDPVQSWALTDNPEPQLNFDLTGTPRRAGDVNGDGTDDYLYAADARDERTPSVLEDETGKTALFFGAAGSLPEEPDQLLYDELRPVGDLDGDGFADAVRLDDSSLRLFTGSASGYTDSGVSLARSILDDTMIRVIGFADFDGDGFGDFVMYTERGSETGTFEIVFGAASLGNAEVRLYETPGAIVEPRNLNAADLDGDGQTAVVEFSGANSNFGGDGVEMEIFRFDAADRSRISAQRFTAEEIQTGADYYRLALIDIDGNGEREILMRRRTLAPYIFTPQFDGTYDETPLEIDAYESAVPIGDLDGDGRHDFYDENLGAVVFGPNDLSTGPVDPISLSDNVSGVSPPLFGSYGRLGDLDGDGLDDAVLGYDGGTPVNPTTGRTFAYGSGDRSVSTANVTYPTGRFFDRIFSTTNVGDLNGDGIEDFTINRRTVNRAEVFFGGETLSPTPDLSLPVPFTQYTDPTIGGDFDGDGFSDVAGVYGSKVDIFRGGSSMDAIADESIDGADFLGNPEGTRFEYGDNIGDVNGDGADDLLFTEGYAAGNENGVLEAFLFFGGASLSSTPDATLTYGDVGFVSDDFAQGLGDVNGDGIDDFALSDPDRPNSNGTAGRIYVYFGEAGTPDFSSADLTITPETPEDEGYYDGFPIGLAAGDFDGDGYDDIAAKPSSVDGSVNDVFINIYEGGPSLDAQADRRLEVPAAPLDGFDANGNGLAESSYGQLAVVPRAGADGLVLTSSWSFNTNALLYDGTATAPDTVLRAPNSSVGLGGIVFANSGHAAIGDFTGDGAPNAVLTQSFDNNDAALSSRVYGYTLGDGAATISGSVDVDEGQTGLVPLGASGATVDITSNAIQNNDSDGGEIQYVRSNTRPPNESFSGSATAPDGTTVTPDAVAPRNWTITSSGLSGLSFNVRLNIAGLGNIGAPDQLLILKRENDGDPWTPLNTMREGDQLVSPALTSFSEFAIGGNAADNPLPVELASFTARADERAAVLEWQTATETGNDGFLVQRRRPTADVGATGRSPEWTRVAFVESKAEGGTSQEPLSYQFRAEGLDYGAHTFRLVQRDLGGGRAPVGSAQSVEIGLSGAYDLSEAYPNPFREQATFALAVREAQNVTVSVYDALGRRVRILHEGPLPAQETKRLTLRAGDLASGVYFVRVVGEDFAETRRAVLVR